MQLSRHRKFERPSVQLTHDPGIEMMLCEPMNVKMTRRACARMFMSNLTGQAPQPWESRHRCLGCPVGAANAGNPKGYSTASAQLWRNACCRCRRAAPRLVNGRLCVSCFNRDREAIRGLDRKGNRPRLIDRLHTEAVVVFDGTEERRVEVERVLDTAELLVALARKATTPLVFSRAAAVHAV